MPRKTNRKGSKWIEAREFYAPMWDILLTMGINILEREVRLKEWTIGTMITIDAC